MMKKGAKAAEDNAPETKDGLQVLKLIRPGMTNDFDFIGLKDGQTVASTQLKVALKGVEDTTFVLSVNGKEISESRIGQRSKKEDVHIQVWLYIGLELNPARMYLRQRCLTRSAMSVVHAKITLMAPGAMASVLVEPSTRTPVADGKTPLRVRVRLVDAHGIPVTSRTPITLESTAGKWDVEDLNPKEPGTQTFIEGGEAECKLIPPMEPIDAKIVVSSGNAKQRSPKWPSCRASAADGQLAVVDQT